MLFKVLIRLIEKGHTEELAEKVDVFFAVGSINKEQYDKLVELLKREE